MLSKVINELNNCKTALTLAIWKWPSFATYHYSVMTSLLGIIKQRNCLLRGRQLVTPSISYWDDFQNLFTPILSLESWKVRNLRLGWGSNKLSVIFHFSRQKSATFPYYFPQIIGSKIIFKTFIYFPVNTVGIIAIFKREWQKFTKISQWNSWNSVILRCIPQFFK